MPRRFLCLSALVATMLVSSEAKAGKYDLDLTPLGQVQTDGSPVTQDDAAFRALSSELGVLMAPKPVDPADSLGLSGFAVSADVTINTLSGGDPYWQDATRNSADNVAPSLQVMGRKGLWPGLEVGAGATHLFDSRMWTISGYGKLALHEGFHHLPIPSIALRGMFSHLLGAKELNMTTISVGASISHVFGVGRTFSITPYAGYDALLIFADSTVLDATPEVDEYTECDGTGSAPAECDYVSEFRFRPQDVIVRHRPYLGARFIFSVLRIGLEAMFVPPGGSTANNDFLPAPVKDSSGFQMQYTVSFGLDF